MIYLCKVGDNMEYRCPKCSAVLIKDDDMYICEYCKSRINPNYFNDKIIPEYIIPFKINKKEAMRIYLNKLNPKSLIPSVFKNFNLINKIEGILLPCYLYSMDSTGDIEYTGDKINKWQSKGINYEKLDTYEIKRTANVSIENMPILTTNELSNEEFNLIEPYDYKDLKKIDEKDIKDYITYGFDKPKKEIEKDIGDKVEKIYINNILVDKKEYPNHKYVDSHINLYNPKRKYIYVPIWRLNLNYKNRTYTYLINGQTGKYYGNVLVKKTKAIYLWIIIFIIILIILVVFSILMGGIL